MQEDQVIIHPPLTPLLPTHPYLWRQAGTSGLLAQVQEDQLIIHRTAGSPGSRGKGLGLRGHTGAGLVMAAAGARALACGGIRVQA